MTYHHVYIAEVRPLWGLTRIIWRHLGWIRVCPMSETRPCWEFLTARGRPKVRCAAPGAQATTGSRLGNPAWPQAASSPTNQIRGSFFGMGWSRVQDDPSFLGALAHSTQKWLFSSPIAPSWAGARGEEPYTVSAALLLICVISSFIAAIL